MTQAYSEREKIRVLLSGSEPKTFRFNTSSDALPLSYMKLVGANATKLGSWFFSKWQGIISVLL